MAGKSQKKFHYNEDFEKFDKNEDEFWRTDIFEDKPKKYKGEWL